MPLHLFFIDDELRAVLHEPESHFNLKFDDTVVDKIFADAEDYSLNQGKQYTLYRSSSNWFAWVIAGIVEEHEPETIWLQSRFGFRNQKQFEVFFNNRT